MKLEHRSYSGKVFRPTPEIEIETDIGLCCLVTPWGPRESASKVIETIKEYLVALRGDTDATSPFPRLTCLSSNTNNLRIAVLLANEKLLREDNENQYTTGTEIFAVSLYDGELSWAQLGHPNVFLNRPGRGLLPIGCHVDLPMDLSQRGEILAPLPNSVLGLDPEVNLQVGSIIPQKGDEFLMVSRSSLPKSFFEISDKEYTLNKMTKNLAEDDKEMAFWLGKLKF